MIKAIEVRFPRSSHQRCLAHRMRHLVAKVPKDRDATHARDASRGALLCKYQAYASWGQGGKRGLSATFDDFARDRLGQNALA